MSVLTARSVISLGVCIVVDYSWGKINLFAQESYFLVQDVLPMVSQPFVFIL